MAICIILLLVTIPFGIAQAGEKHGQENNNYSISVELSTIDSDKISTTETILLSEEELVEIEKTISILIDKLQSVNSLREFKGIINNLLKGSNLKMFSILIPQLQ